MSFSPKSPIQIPNSVPFVNFCATLLENCKQGPLDGFFLYKKAYKKNALAGNVFNCNWASFLLIIEKGTAEGN